jgi:hypothetical protein
MAETTEVKETRNLTEKIGKDKARLVASLGLAAATLLGISGKPNTGMGSVVEVPNPATGEQVGVGVMVSSTEENNPFFGAPRMGDKYFRDVEAFEIKVGNARLTVATGVLEGGDRNVRTVAISPGFETTLGK